MALILQFSSQRARPARRRHVDVVRVCGGPRPGVAQVFGASVTEAALRRRFQPVNFYRRPERFD